MPILKLEIFQNSKSQKCKLWGRPPPLFGKSLHFEFFFMMASLRIIFRFRIFFYYSTNAKYLFHNTMKIVIGVYIRII